MRSAEEYPVRATVGDVSLAADVYDSPDKAKAGFHLDVTSEGFYPVNLILRNGTNDRIFVLRETVALTDAGGTVWRPVRSAIMAGVFEYSRAAHLILAGVLDYAAVTEANLRMQSDWREKEIPDQLLILPGQRAHGFVYFRLPKDQRPKGGTLRVDVEKVETKKTIQFELRL
ncbi:MAG: hypothetical protein HYY45_16950 [Deltaproteobacteria bacterium]|nr:hypothetical protein [Deltaproteobacteria bacterium]